MKALILAAGYAVRLYPLTKEFPKPLLEVGKKPIINYIIEKLKNIDDIDEIIVITNSKFISRFRKWKLKLRCKKKISLLDDLTKSHNERLGAIGDMNFAIDKKCISDDLLVVGADNIFDGDLEDFLSFSRSKRLHPVIGVYDIKNIIKAKNYGVIKLGRGSKVIDFQEKPKSPKSSLVAMCLYIFPKEKLYLIEQYAKVKKNKQDATGFYVDWLRRKGSVYGFIFIGNWYDIGDRRFYNEANKKFTK